MFHKIISGRIFIRDKFQVSRVRVKIQKTSFKGKDMEEIRRRYDGDREAIGRRSGIS
jgi:hypothetical protein